MKKHRKTTSGPTIPSTERDKRGYGNVLYSLPHTTKELVERFASRYGITKSAVIVMAIGALVQVEGEP